MKVGDLVIFPADGMKATIKRINKNGTVRVSWYNERFDKIQSITVKKSDIKKR